MRFCRYCGVPIPEDSLFCPKCGKRLGRRPRPRLDRAVATLKLNTPYPYFAALLIAAAVWMILWRKPAFDYAHLDWSVELGERAGPDEQGDYRQTVWLIGENTGADAIQDIPVDLSVRIEPEAPAEITARFAGRRLTLSAAGKAIPLTLILGEIPPGAKRRFLLEGTVRARPPFTVIYEFRDQSRKKVLARYATEP
jgi:hypothetical protein